MKNYYFDFVVVLSLLSHVFVYNCVQRSNLDQENGESWVGGEKHYYEV